MNKKFQQFWIIMKLKNYDDNVYCIIVVNTLCDAFGHFE